MRTGLIFQRRLDDGLGVLLDVQDANVIPGLAQDRGQVAEPEVALVLKPDQHYGARGIAPAPNVGSPLLDAAQRNRLTHAIVGFAYVKYLDC